MIGRWHAKPLIFETVEGLLKEMRRFQIGSALVTHTRSWKNDPVEGNTVLVRELVEYSNLRPVIALTPLLDMEFGGIAALAEFVKHHHCAAIRLFPKDQGFTLYSFNQRKIFDFAKQMRLPVMIDFWQLDMRFDLLFQLLRQYPDVTIVLIEPYYRSFRVIYDLFEQCPNLYGDMSVFKGSGAIEDFVSRFGSQRLLFSTKMPFMEGSLNIGLLIYSNISCKDKENIAFRNAERLFGREDI
jgi:predicted TIM-barrel fold metal-dependent hydrolase